MTGQGISSSSMLLKVTTILIEINNNICYNAEVNICCINQYSVKK